MIRFNYSDGTVQFDSLLLCEIGPVGNNSQTPGTIPVDEPVMPKGSGDVKDPDQNQKVPPAGDNMDVPSDKETPLADPKKEITPQNTQSLLSQMDTAEKAIVSITELLQAIIKMNRERKDMEVKMLWSECQSICNNIQSQADNIRKDAVKNLIVGLCCSAVSVISGSITLSVSAKGLKDLSAAKTEMNKAMSVENVTEEAKRMALDKFNATRSIVDARGQYWNAVGEMAKAASQMGSNISDFFSKQMEAENKELDATNEVLRTAIEEIKKAMDDARNSITSCQSNISELLQTNRQTLNKVMG
ncbi:MAG: hypothetical protein II929_05665 [Succinivibrio sp.]|nr:hypothetical protein [Succinivibrio sp.]